MSVTKEQDVGSKVWNIIEKLMEIVLVKVLHIKFSSNQWNGLVQFVKFGIVGLSNTVVSYVIYVGALLLFQKQGWVPKVDYLVAQIIAFVLSVLWSFYWNNRFVFTKKENEERNILQALIKTYISYAFTGLFLNSLLSLLWVEVFTIPKIVAPIINLIVSVPINFLMNKFWAFKGKSDNNGGIGKNES